MCHPGFSLKSVRMRQPAEYHRPGMCHPAHFLPVHYLPAAQRVDRLELERRLQGALDLIQGFRHPWLDSGKGYRSA